MESVKIATTYFIPFYRSIMARRRSRHRHVISDARDIIECQSLIWKTVADHYLENEGGVYINNIGYLCHVICPVRSLSINRVTGDINRKGTDGYKYTHCCVDFLPRNKFFHLVVQDALKRKSRELMNAGRRYKFLYREVQSEREVFGREWVHRIG